ncbi:hypothetical protein [Tabrizicola soli]|uniref:Calcineurin-like phosphoesterase domain-containing protein n=1 Tax=Tabrizicola soli TaxID=2185115 RepID=A0ABV7E1G3_9RHOB
MDVLRAAADFFFEQRVDHVFHLGDLGEFRSGNTHKGGALMGGDGSDEGHDLRQDIEIWRNGLQVLRRPWKVAIEKHRSARHLERIHPCQHHILFGNHEDMPYRIGRKYPALRSIMDLPEMDMYGIARKEGYTPYPFLSPVDVNGLLLQHYFEGLNPKIALAMNSVQTRNSMSSAFGHTHLRDVRIWKNGRRQMQTILNTGCSKHPDRLRRYEESGVWLIDNLMDGEFNYSWVKAEDLLANYYRKNGRLAA